MPREETAENSRDLKAVLARLAQVYSSCMTYEDQGVARESMPDEGGQERLSEDFFTTAFDRTAKQFRYEFRTGSPQVEMNLGCMVWRNGDAEIHLHLWASGPKLVAKLLG